LPIDPDLPRHNMTLIVSRIVLKRQNFSSCLADVTPGTIPAAVMCGNTGGRLWHVTCSRQRELPGRSWPR